MEPKSLPTRNVDVFKYRKELENPDGGTSYVGCEYLDTKDISLKNLTLFIERDIVQTIKAGELPALKVGLSVFAGKFCDRLEIDISPEKIKPEDAACGLRSARERTGSAERCKNETGTLTDTGFYIKRKIEQILWKYNYCELSETLDQRVRRFAHIIRLKGFMQRNHDNGLSLKYLANGQRLPLRIS